MDYQQDGGAWDQPLNQTDQWGRSIGDPQYGVPPGSSSTAPSAPWGQTPLGQWEGAGVSQGDIFNPETGQLNPGWQRTATGYGRVGNTPDPTNTGTGGSNFAPFSGTYTPPSLPTLPAPPMPVLPERRTPPPFQFAEFTPPSAEDVFKDPGYKFRFSQGHDALQRWAAARGTLNDTGTANALTDYGQNAASQEFGNVWNRGLEAYKTNRTGAIDTYNTNYRTQYEDPWRAEYQTGIDSWIPQMEGWRTNADLARLGYTTQADQAWGLFLNDWDRWKDERDTGILLAGS